jgi:hypothetical protein
MGQEIRGQWPVLPGAWDQYWGAAGRVTGQTLLIFFRSANQSNSGEALVDK